jgi:hypothetical protein
MAPLFYLLQDGGISLVDVAAQCDPSDIGGSTGGIRLATSLGGILVRGG